MKKALRIKGSRSRLSFRSRAASSTIMIRPITPKMLRVVNIFIAPSTCVNHGLILTPNPAAISKITLGIAVFFDIILKKKDRMISEAIKIMAMLLLISID